MEHPFWNAHYQTFNLQQPSSFAHYCATQHLRPSDALVELGCGNGRDGLMLLQCVSRYVGVDLCSLAIDSFARATTRIPLNGHQAPDLRIADFTAMDFNELGDEVSRVALYSRFSLHTITYDEQERLLDRLADIHVSPWVFLIEARTIHDRLHGVGRKVGPHEYETDHYRRFIDPDAFMADVSGRFKITYFEVSDGLAPYRDEDPVLMRAVLEGPPRA